MFQLIKRYAYNLFRTYSLLSIIVDSLLGKVLIANMGDIVARLDMCRTCRWLNNKTNRCKACGCLVTFKAEYAKSKCPFSMW